MPGHAWLRRLTLAATLAGLLFLNPSIVQGQPRVTWVSGGSVGASSQVAPDQYIVVLKDDVVSIPTVAREMAEQYRPRDQPGVRTRFERFRGSDPEGDSPSGLHG